MIVDLVKLFPQSSDKQNITYMLIDTKSIKGLISSRLPNKKVEHMIELEEMQFKIDELETEVYQDLAALYYAEKIILLTDRRKQKKPIADTSIVSGIVLQAYTTVEMFKQKAFKP